MALRSGRRPPRRRALTVLFLFPSLFPVAASPGAVCVSVLCMLCVTWELLPLVGWLLLCRLWSDPPSIVAPELQPPAAAPVTLGWQATLMYIQSPVGIRTSLINAFLLLCGRNTPSCAPKTSGALHSYSPQAMTLQCFPCVCSGKRLLTGHELESHTCKHETTRPKICMSEHWALCQHKTPSEALALLPLLALSTQK